MKHKNYRAPYVVLLHQNFTERSLSRHYDEPNELYPSACCLYVLDSPWVFDDIIITIIVIIIIIINNINIILLQSQKQYHHPANE